MFFIPIGLIVLGAVLFIIGRSQDKKASDLSSIETSNAAELATSASEVAKEIGAGSFRQTAEVKGSAECAHPLQGELSGQACVWYRCTVTREYEETYTERDSEGKSVTRTRRGSENVSNNERRTEFKLQDSTGTIAIWPDGASIDGEKILSRFEQGKEGASLSFGGLSLNFGKLGGGRRTIGYKMEEWGIPLGRKLYILGEASDNGGQLHIGKPEEKGKRFIISVKSEEELVKSAKTGGLVLKIIAAAAAAGALLSLFFVF